MSSPEQVECDYFGVLLLAYVDHMPKNSTRLPNVLHIRQHHLCKNEGLNLFMLVYKIMSWLLAIAIKSPLPLWSSHSSPVTPTGEILSLFQAGLLIFRKHKRGNSKFFVDKIGNDDICMVWLGVMWRIAQIKPNIFFSNIPSKSSENFVSPNCFYI